MNKIKRVGNWYLLLNKRFLKKYIFTILLLSVPLLVIGMRIAAAEDSGVLRVLLCVEGAEVPQRTGTDAVIRQLLEKQGIIQYEEADNLEEACEKVRRGKADCVWEFPGDLQGTVRQFIKRKKSNIMNVYVREDNVQTKLAREQLYGFLYPLISYETTRDFLDNQPYFEEMKEEEMDSRLQKIYESYKIEESVFRFAYLDDTEYQKKENRNSYLTAPLRGMLAVLIFLCGLAVTLFYLQDQKEKIFVWMPIKHRSLFPWLYILIGTLDAGIAAFLALYISGSFTAWPKEILLMLGYVLAVAGFCNLLRIFTGNIRRMGASIPVLILVTLVLCPVFLNIRKFPMIQYMLPAYYYLNSLYSGSMAVRMIIYTSVVCISGILLESVWKKPSLRR